MRFASLATKNLFPRLPSHSEGLPGHSESWPVIRSFPPAGRNGLQDAMTGLYSNPARSTTSAGQTPRPFPTALKTKLTVRTKPDKVQIIIVRFSVNQE